MFKIEVCKGEMIEDILCCFKCIVSKDGIFVEVCKCEYYIKLGVDCCMKVKVVKIKKKKR